MNILNSGKIYLTALCYHAFQISVAAKISVGLGLLHGIIFGLTIYIMCAKREFYLTPGHFKPHASATVTVHNIIHPPIKLFFSCRTF
jgi:hypothetical protein